VPLDDDVGTCFARDLPLHAPDAWVDPDNTTLGYETPFNRHSYVFIPPRRFDQVSTRGSVLLLRHAERRV
jgi:type I restriction enzyme M protein